MSWVCRISREASRQLERFPKDHQKQIYASLEEMETDPFAGDIKPIKSGKYKDYYRKRVGKYRIIFDANKENKLVLIITVVRRGDHTYD